MKFSICGFNQSALVSLGLTIVDAEILRWFVDFQGTGRMRDFSREDGCRFFLVSYKAVIEDLPVIDVTSVSAITRRFKKLVECGVLEHYHATCGGSFSCYRIGKKYLNLVADPSSVSADPPAPAPDPSSANAGPPPALALEQKTLLPNTHLPDSQDPPTPAGGAGDGVPEGPVKTRYRDADVDALVRHWNASGLPAYRRVPVLLVSFPEASAVVEALSYYSPDEVHSAIDAYAHVSANRGDFAWGATYPTPSSFFIKGVPLFCPDSKPLERLRKVRAGEAKPTLIEAPKALVCGHCGTPKGGMGYCLNGDCEATYIDNADPVWVSPEVYQNGRAV